ncbi:MAG: hypothetical protein OEN20_11990 [Gammaproteobacteria bacterium]|nr:hypothetical protein [Gammaproteobacteria bacterium]
MLKQVLLYAGAAVIVVWGFAHIAIPTKNIVDGFRPLSEDNERILKMEWIMEGLTLGFIGALVGCMTLLRGVDDAAAIIVYRAAGIMLVVMAGVSLFTGARTAILPMKLCPAIFTLTAVLFWLATFI